jgi:HTH-type transcriptional regulator/antitoxin HigA
VDRLVIAVIYSAPFVVVRFVRTHEDCDDIDAGEVQVMDLKPIHTVKQHEAALKEIERLWASKPGTPRHDRLEVLATLVEDYEEKHLSIYPPDPVAAIRFRMEQLDLDRKALEPSIGSRARVSEVLSGRRRFTLDMIRRLHRQLGIPAEVLLASLGAARGTRRGRPTATSP